MKTKITLLLIFCVILSSCIKDFYGHPDDENGILTETNYFYADDFKSEFLELKVAALDIELKELSAIIESQEANDSIFQRFDNATQEKFETSEQINDIAGYRDFVYKRRPPLPVPCPKPQSCFPGIQYLTVSPETEFYELIVTNSNGEIIGTTVGNPVKLDNFDDLLSYVVFKFDKPDYNGEIQIQVTEKLSTEEDALYFTLDSNIEQEIF